MIPTLTTLTRTQLAMAVSALAMLAASGIQAQAADLKLAPKASAPAPAAPAPPAPPPAPLGVFGGDSAPEGKFVFTTASSFAQLSGSRIDTNVVSNEFIVTNVPFFNDPVRRLRGVPQKVNLFSQTVALAYGVTSDITLVAASGFASKALDFLTFRGPAGAIPLGRSATATRGIVDTAAAVVWRAYKDPIHSIRFNFGFSLPTGRITDPFTLLGTNGVPNTSRAFYAMQIGAGTVDAMPGVVYSGFLEKWSWGLAYRARIPFGRNENFWAFGDLHEFNGWGGYSWVPGFTTTARVNGSTQGRIRGGDPTIRGAAQAANPNFYGGQRVELFGGATISGKFIGLDAATILVEAGGPVYQKLNGPQIQKNWQATIGFRYKL